jgi:hypothetical protein
LWRPSSRFRWSPGSSSTGCLAGWACQCRRDRCQARHPKPAAAVSQCRSSRHSRGHRGICRTFEVVATVTTCRCDACTTGRTNQPRQVPCGQTDFRSWVRWRWGPGRRTSHRNTACRRS